MSVGNKILTTVCACTINALQGNVPAIKLALGVAILTHRTKYSRRSTIFDRTSFLANNVSTAIARYYRMTGKSNVGELVCQRDVCEAFPLPDNFPPI